MTKKEIFKKAVAGLLSVALLICLCACGKKESEYPTLDSSFPGKTITFSFGGEASEVLNFSAESAESVANAVAQITPDYTHSDMYELDEVKKRLEFDATVKEHKFSALNSSGVLTADSLYQKVVANNKTYLEQDDFGYEVPEDEYLVQLCDFIVKVVEAMREKYPDLDWERVYCNLGNMKILYDVGMLSYAQVTDQMVLCISETNSSILLNMKGKNGFGDVLTHEMIHVIQMGCSCENIENCTRRAGISLYWKDFTLNTTDWTWMIEGAAERHMCALTGHEAISYQYKMDYLCSLNMSVILRDSVEADTIDLLCFQNDPQLLFDAFGCETEEEKDELLNMMITLQVLQIQPSAFFIAYQEKTGVDLKADEETLNQFCYSLKPSICTTLAKEFYENLTVFLQENEVTYNDLFFLINLFEGHLNQHLRYSNTANQEINEPFFAAYNVMRTALFDALEKDNPDKDFDALYADYAIQVDGKELLNAELAMLPEDKREFLAERAQWQSELEALGVKAP